jgi:hypothetical protein
MPQPKKTGEPDVPARVESEVRVKPKTLAPRTREEFLRALDAQDEEETELDRELNDALESGRMSLEEVVDRLATAQLAQAQHIMNKEELAELGAKLRETMLKLWRDED